MSSVNIVNDLNTSPKYNVLQGVYPL